MRPNLHYNDFMALSMGKNQYNIHFVFAKVFTVGPDRKK